MSLGDLLLPSLFGRSRPELKLTYEGWLPFTKVPAPDRRLLRIEATPESAPPVVGDLVEPLARLGSLGNAPVLAPFAARVAELRPAPYFHGGRAGHTVVLERDPDGPKTPAKLDPLSDDASREELLDRLEVLGVCALGREALSLASLLGPSAEHDGPEAVVVNAADAEPLLASEGQLLVERGGEVDGALGLLKRAAGTKEVYLTVPGALESAARDAVGEARIVPLPDRYPETLGDLAARRAVGESSRSTVVVSLESVLAMAKAIDRGVATTERHITVVGADESRQNVVVEAGTPASEVFEHLGFAVEKEDIVLFGGPMRGRSEYLLDASVDVTTSALMIVPPLRAPQIANDPCVSCGSCIEVCPARLEPQWLGRNAEFGFFDRNEELEIEACVQCGLCAYVCPSGRPLLQWIELSLAELAKARDAETEQEA